MQINTKAPKLFPDELIEQFLAQVQNKNAESILGESGIAGQIKKQLAERMLAAELNHHLSTEAETPANHNPSWRGLIHFCIELAGPKGLESGVSGQM